MKYTTNLKLLLIISLLTAGCGSSIGDSTSPDTGEGNEETTATNATLSAVTGGANGFFDFGSAGSLSTKASKKNRDVETMDCSYSEEEEAVTCSCPGGGHMTHTFAGEFEQSECSSEEGIAGYIYSFNSRVTMTFEDCVMLECGSSVTINGSSAGSASGESNSCTGRETFSAEFATAEPCSGITIRLESGDEVTVGYEMTFSNVDGVESMSGTICVNGEAIDFSNADEVKEHFGRDHSCSEPIDEEDYDEENEDEEWDDHEEDDWDHEE